MKISEVNIDFVKPSNGLVAFASIVIDDAIYLGSIAIHKKIDGTGYRLTFPTKGLNKHIYHPINRPTSKTIELAIFEKLKNVMKRAENDRHSYNTYE